MEPEPSFARLLLESRERSKRRQRNEDRLPPLPIGEAPVLLVSTLEEALEELLTEAEEAEAAAGDRIAELRERDQHTVALLLALGLMVDDDEVEIAPGVTKGAFFAVAYRVAERICSREEAMRPKGQGPPGGS